MKGCKTLFQFKYRGDDCGKIIIKLKSGNTGMKNLLVIVFVLLSGAVVRADEGMWLLSKLKEQNIDEMQKMIDSYRAANVPETEEKS